MDKSLYVIGRSVLIVNDLETWLGPAPIDSLLKKMGASVAVQVETGGDEEVVICLTCTAPDVSTARHLADSLGKRMRGGWQAWNEYIGPNDRFPRFYKGQAESSGRTLVLSNVLAEWDVWPFVLSMLNQLLAGLEAQGCTDFDFTFEQGIDES